MEMMPITKTEAEIINYLYKNREKTPYVAEIMRELKIPKSTAYRSLNSLEKKGIVEKELRGRMKFYKLTERWMEVAEAAKVSIAETGEAIIPTEVNSSLRGYLKFAKKQIEAYIQKLDHAKDVYKKDEKVAFAAMAEISRKILQLTMDELQKVSKIEDVANILVVIIDQLHKIWLIMYPAFPEASKELEQTRNLLSDILMKSVIKQRLNIDFKTIHPEAQKALKDIADTAKQKLQVLLKSPTNFQDNKF